MFSAAAVAVCLAITAYAYLRYVYSYWWRHGFPHLTPSIPVGNLGSVVAGRASIGVRLHQLYEQASTPFVGIYMLFKPVLLIRDAALARRILSADFAHFHDRGVYCNPKYDPLSENLFAMTGHRWRALRSKLTPTFTTGKLKSMLSNISVESDRLLAYLGGAAERAELVEVKDLMSRYSLNVIGSVIFGVEADTINDPDHTFRTIEKRILNTDLFNRITGVSVFLCPKILEFFNINSIQADVQQFMIEIVEQQIEYRERVRMPRKDFIQSLIQLRNTGAIHEVDRDDWDLKASDERTLKKMSIKECAAQVFIFYMAGFDTSASTTAFSLFELARHPEIRRKLQAEIDETVARFDGVVSYECIQEMQYLEACIMETTRMYPTLPLLNRECTIDYTIPGTDLVIKKGTAVIISLLGLGRDARYFDEPLRYRPERFADPDRVCNMDAYLPFGDGPRTCIGLRMGKMSAKIALIQLLRKYDFESIDTADLEFDTFAATLQVKGGINLRVTNRAV